MRRLMLNEEALRLAKPDDSGRAERASVFDAKIESPNSARSTASGTQRRKHARYNLPMMVGMDCGGGEWAPMGVTDNVGAGGLLVESDIQVEIGMLHMIHFAWGSDVFTCEVRVVRRDQRGIALEFVNIDKLAQQAIVEATAGLSPATRLSALALASK